MRYHGHREGWKLFRWWLYLTDMGGANIYLELSLLSKSVGIGVKIVGPGGEPQLLFQISVWLFSFYLGLSGRWLGSVTKKLLRGSYESRAIGLRIFDAGIWWDCWAPVDSWSSKEPKWMRFTWHPLDSFFGRLSHSEETLETVQTVIPMPEKSYPCTVVLKRERWKRQRVPWVSKHVMRAHIDCPEGIPYPGKGESEWDCGDDATYGLCCKAETLEQGIAAFVETVLRSRRRYGGSVNWKKATA